MLYKVSCHCGSVQLEVETDLSMIKQCDCSICKRKNAKMSILPKEAIKSIKGEDNLSVYQFDFAQIQALTKQVKRSMELSITMSGESCYIASELGECEVVCTTLKE